MIQVTDKAFKWFYALKNNNKYLLITLKSSGCNGFKYDLNWTDNLFENVIYQKEIIKYLDNQFIVAYPLIFKDKLDNITLDIIKEGINEKLYIENPNIKNECGCGESIGF